MFSLCVSFRCKFARARGTPWKWELRIFGNVFQACYSPEAGFVLLFVGRLIKHDRARIFTLIELVVEMKV